MKIRGLELEQFRKFERPVRISGFADRLNVLCGPNEFGKSTILAAIRGLMFESHRSKAEPVKRMQPWGGKAGPRLAMDFEIEGGIWRIEKHFIVQPSARLTTPDGHRFEGDDAEEALQRLLGFGAAGRKGATAEHFGVWGALWVSQRQSVEQADLSSDLARTTVGACLDAEVGVLTGSEKGRAILREAAEHYGRLIDGNGKPKGRYKEVTTAIAALEVQIGDLRARQKQLWDAADELRGKEATLAKAEDAAAIQEEQRLLADARRGREAAQLFEKTLAAAAAEHSLAQRDREAAETEVAARKMRRAAIAEKGRTSRAAAAEVAQGQDRARIADDRLARSRAAVAAANLRAAEAAALARDRRNIQAFAQESSVLAGLAGALQNAEAVQRDITALTARHGAVLVTKTRIEAIRKAARDADTARAALRAQATVIDVDLEDGAVDRVTLDGTALPAGRRTISAVMQTEIAIAGIGHIVVLPAIKDREKSLAQAGETARLLESLLAECACGDTQAAESAWDERQALESALREARTTLSLLTPGDPATELNPGLEALRERVAVRRLQIEARRQALALADPPGPDEAAREAAAAEAAEAHSREALALAHAERDAAMSASSAERQVLIKAEAAAAAAAEMVARLDGEEGVALERESDAALAVRRASAEAALQNSAALRADIERQRPADGVTAMDVRIQRYEQALKNRAENTRKLRERIVELRTRITQEGGAGLDEVIAAAERERDLLIRERDATSFDGQALKLLLDTLTAAERESKERYLAPVKRRVTPYLRSLFPGATIECDENLLITGLTRDGTGLQEFERLSDGTQEQIAVLARLAFAELLSDQGKPAMLILDDALAFSDDERIERMFDILGQAAARMQILVLSCRETLFARLGGHRLEVRSAG